MAQVAGQHVRGEADELERQVRHQQVRRRRHEEHAERAREQERVVLALVRRPRTSREPSDIQIAASSDRPSRSLKKTRRRRARSCGRRATPAARCRGVRRAPARPAAGASRRARRRRRRRRRCRATPRLRGRGRGRPTITARIAAIEHQLGHEVAAGSRPCPWRATGDADARGRRRRLHLIARSRSSAGSAGRGSAFG